MTTTSFQYIDAGGHTFSVATASKRTLTGYSGMGMPPAEYFWQQMPDRDGSQYLGHRFGNRTVNIVVMDCATDRTDAWSNAGSYHQAFNPTLGRGTLRATLPDGTTRDLMCRIVDGLGFDTEERLPPTINQQPIQLISEEPHWRDSNQNVETFTLTAGTNTDVYCTVGGDVESWPRITIEQTSGTLAHPVVEVLETSDKVDLDVNLTNQEWLVIESDTPSVTRSNGSALMGSATTSSVFFSLARGPNTLRFTAGTGCGTGTVRWKDRYTGLYIVPTTTTEVTWTRGYDQFDVQWNQSTDTFTKGTSTLSESWS